MTRERVSGVTFDEVVDIARQIEMVRGQERAERETKRPHGQGGFSGAPQGGQFQQSQSSFSALSAQGSHYAPPAQVSSGNIFGHKEKQFRQRRGCFECGYFGHIARYCPRLLGETPERSTRPTTPAPVPPPPAHPARGGAQSATGLTRGGGRSGGGQARFYALPARPDAIASDALFVL
ncbi:uncharacterized protein [Nicotiana tomentosiformis]|uniref:uncharacterized protein n=1 Tax=Nicotiana tomentosiformis TaxID=4098 RepID=UPI00388CA11C